jgi:hypothetical protein
MAIKLSDKQRDEAMKIASLGAMFGGTKEMDSYLMQAMMNVLIPETDEMDEMASLYSLTEDEGLKQDMLSKYYEGQGIDPAKKAQEEALLAQFAEQFPSESQDAGKNISYQTFMQQNPEALSQYYDSKPSYEGEMSNLAAIGGGIGAGALTGGGIVGPPGILIGGLLGGGLGLGSTLIRGNERKKEEEQRIKSLMEQYQSNIPKN